MRCVKCNTDLGKENTIVARQDVLMCVKCAAKEPPMDCSEEVVPSDIGIYPEEKE